MYELLAITRQELLFGHMNTGICGTTSSPNHTTKNQSIPVLPSTYFTTMHSPASVLKSNNAILRTDEINDLPPNPGAARGALRTSRKPGPHFRILNVTAVAVTSCLLLKGVAPLWWLGFPSASLLSL